MRAIHVIDAETLQRVRQPLSAEPRPFLRWAGSKRYLLPEIISVLPPVFRGYWEPFLGSGALFFGLQPQRAVLGDSCHPLIEAFVAVRDDVNRVLGHLSLLKPDRETYYQVRHRHSRGRFKRTADFMFLNKTCWNGLYRVNSRGQFNVPFGSPKSPTLVDPSNLRSCSRLLRSTELEFRVGDFEQTLDGVGPCDLVYLDPPYVTRHNNNGFVDYNEVLFSWDDQLRLAGIARSLVERGAHVVTTNAFHDEVIDLYEGFQLRALERKSTLASDTSKRGRVKEAILFVTHDCRFEKHAEMEPATEG